MRFRVSRFFCSAIGWDFIVAVGAIISANFWSMISGRWFSQSSCSCSLLASESSWASASAPVSVFALEVCAPIIASALSCLSVSDSVSLPYFLLRSSSFQLVVLVCLVRGRLGSVSFLLLVAGQCFVPGFPWDVSS